MRKSLLAAAVTGVILLSAGVQAQEQAAPEGYQLQQVLIMSRHNLRAAGEQRQRAGAINAEVLA